MPRVTTACQENDAHTGSWCMDKPVLPRDARYQSACSPVDRMYATAKPGVTTLGMAENHVKPNSSGLQYQA